MSWSRFSDVFPYLPGEWEAQCKGSFFEEAQRGGGQFCRRSWSSTWLVQGEEVGSWCEKIGSWLDLPWFPRGGVWKVFTKLPLMGGFEHLDMQCFQIVQGSASGTDLPLFFGLFPTILQLVGSIWPSEMRLERSRKARKSSSPFVSFWMTWRDGLCLDPIFCRPSFMRKNSVGCFSSQRCHQIKGHSQQKCSHAFLPLPFQHLANLGAAHGFSLGQHVHQTVVFFQGCGARWVSWNYHGWLQICREGDLCNLAFSQSFGSGWGNGSVYTSPDKTQGHSDSIFLPTNPNKKTQCFFVFSKWFYEKTTPELEPGEKSFPHDFLGCFLFRIVQHESMFPMELLNSCQ